jgi:hypothetical protein
VWQFIVLPLLTTSPRVFLFVLLGPVVTSPVAGPKKVRVRVHVWLCVLCAAECCPITRLASWPFTRPPPLSQPVLDLDWDRDAGVISGPVMHRHDGHLSTDVINPVHRMLGDTSTGGVARAPRMASPEGIELEQQPRTRTRRTRGDVVSVTGPSPRDRCGFDVSHSEVRLHIP